VLTRYRNFRNSRHQASDRDPVRRRADAPDHAAAPSDRDGALHRLLVFLRLTLLFGGLGSGSLAAPPTLVFAGHHGLSPARTKCQPETTLPQTEPNTMTHRRRRPSLRRRRRPGGLPRTRRTRRRLRLWRRPDLPSRCQPERSPLRRRRARHQLHAREDHPRRRTPRHDHDRQPTHHQLKQPALTAGGTMA